MKRRFIFPILVAVLAVAWCAPAADPPQLPKIRFPEPALPLTPPVPPPNPASPILLPAEWLYVVDSDVELLAWVFPGNGLTIHKETGPVKVRGKFVGGAGKIETKSFSGKQILIITSTATTTEATLMILPLGATKESDAIMKQFAVTTVPDPPKPPDPKPPDPTVPIPGDGLRVLIVYETAATMTAAQQGAVWGKQVRDYLNSHCVAGAKMPEWRVYDKDTVMDGETKLWQDAMKRPRASVPWVVISNGRAGYEGPLPADKDSMLALLRKYGGQ